MALSLYRARLLVFVVLMLALLFLSLVVLAHTGVPGHHVVADTPNIINGWH